MSKFIKRIVSGAEYSMIHTENLKEVAKEIKRREDIEKRFREVKNIKSDDFREIIFCMTKRVFLYAGSEFCNREFTIKELKELKALLENACDGKFLIDGKSKYQQYKKYLFLVNSVLKEKRFLDGEKKIPKNIKILAKRWTAFEFTQLAKCFSQKEFLPQILMKLDEAKEKILEIKSRYANEL